MKEVWSPLEPSPLNNKVVSRIADALIGAKKPLIVTSYLGRNPAAVPALVKLVDLLGVGVFQSCLSVVNLPFDHPSHLGLAFGGKNPFVEEADVVLIIDSDVPWLPMFTKHKPDAQMCAVFSLPLLQPREADFPPFFSPFFSLRLPLSPLPPRHSFHLDVDPLKERMSFATYPAQIRAKADAQLSLEQLYDYATSSSKLASAQSSISARRTELEKGHKERAAALKALEVPEEGKDDIMTAPFVVASYRKHVTEQKLKSLVLNEAISNVRLLSFPFFFLSSRRQLTLPPCLSPLLSPLSPSLPCSFVRPRSRPVPPRLEPRRPLRARLPHLVRRILPRMGSRRRYRSEDGRRPLLLDGAGHPHRFCRRRFLHFRRSFCGILDGEALRHCAFPSLSLSPHEGRNTRGRS